VKKGRVQAKQIKCPKVAKKREYDHGICEKSPVVNYEKAGYKMCSYYRNQKIKL
jgi:hypothetical protein